MTQGGMTRLNRRMLLKSAATGTAAALAAPMVARADSKSIKIGMPTILSGRVAQLGNLLTQCRDDGGGEDQRRGRSRRTADRNGDPRFEGAAAGSRPRCARTGQHRRLRDPDRRARLRPARSRCRRWCAISACSVIHTDSETSARCPPIRSCACPTRSARCRQGIHDSIVGGSLCRRDREGKELDEVDDLLARLRLRPRHHRASSSTYLKRFEPDVEVVSESWPKLFQPDYTEVITKILQAKPQALYTCLCGGDLTAFIDQGNIYALFGQTESFAVNMADYTALTAVKNLPQRHPFRRTATSRPSLHTKDNAAWGDAYRK